jgi:hypothetical protein
MTPIEHDHHPRAGFCSAGTFGAAKSAGVVVKILLRHSNNPN